LKGKMSHRSRGGSKTAPKEKRSDARAEAMTAGWVLAVEPCVAAQRGRFLPRKKDNSTPAAEKLQN